MEEGHVVKPPTEIKTSVGQFERALQLLQDRPELMSRSLRDLSSEFNIGRDTWSRAKKSLSDHRTDIGHH